jgi:redox-sensitive bicupin YhaK (pirin superfamily)
MFKIYIFLSIIIFTMSFVFKPTWQAEGQGASVLRIINNKHLKSLDPFLMLDFFKVKLPAGFPDHPHRGF